MGRYATMEATIQIIKECDTLQEATEFIQTLESVGFEIQGMERKFDEKWEIKYEATGTVISERVKEW